MEIKSKEKLNIQDITIPENYKKHPPKWGKMKEKWEHYRQNNKLKEEIIINENNVLIDGYTSYLIAEADGIKKVDVTKIISRPWFIDTSDANDHQGYICVYHEKNKRKQMFDKNIHKENYMYIKDIIKICIALTFMVIGIYGIIWYIKQIIAMCMEVGG